MKKEKKYEEAALEIFKILKGFSMTEKLGILESSKLTFNNVAMDK